MKGIGMICNDCNHYTVCKMWLRFMGEVGVFRDISEIPDLTKTTDCPHLERKYKDESNRGQ